MGRGFQGDRGPSALESRLKICHGEKKLSSDGLGVRHRKSRQTGAGAPPEHPCGDLAAPLPLPPSAVATPALHTGNTAESGTEASRLGGIAWGCFLEN